ncbi:hypothetical protein BJX70DRAFT_142974 [Aspergillus crustosus]
MRCWNDRAAIFENSRALLFGIIYPAIYITCALLLAQRIRRRQRRKYMQLERQMNTPSEKDVAGGKQSSGATTAEVSEPTHTIYDRAPLPSACDILQPLSHSVPLPPSGHLVNMLIEQAGQRENRIIQPSGPSHHGFGDATPVDLRTHHTSIQGSPTHSDDSSQPTSPSSRRSVGYNADSPDSGEAQSVQRRSQQVQFLHEADGEGVRTWKRYVVEYS